VTIRAGLGIAAGGMISLALPAAYWILGLGLEGGTFTEEQVRPFADVLSATSLAEILLQRPPAAVSEAPPRWS
jgi:hypothetical protein